MKENYLFIDSSFYIQVGLLSKDFDWIHYEYVPQQKGSTVLHSIIFQVLRDAAINVQDLKALIIANGPGSYTGIRLTEGIAQIMEVEGVNVISFYHFEVPLFCHINNYKFYANAFKGEIFEYTYCDKEKAKTSMVKKEDFMKIPFDDPHIYHISGELNDRYLESTIDLIKNKPRDIFSRVVEINRHSEPYYFRSLEKEFKTSFNIDGNK